MKPVHLTTLDEGKQLVPDATGEGFEAYVMAFEAECRHCDRPLRGRSVVDVRLAELGVPTPGAHRAWEDAAFRSCFLGELEAHERRHWVIRAVKWLARVWWQFFEGT